MFLKIINAVFIIIAVYLGLKHGWNMLNLKTSMVEMFSKWNFSKTGLMINGAITILAAILILFPKTFIWGNFLMAAGILLIICCQISQKDFKGVLIEVPFLLLNLLIIYLQHPLQQQSNP